MFRLSEEEDKTELTGFLMLLFGYEAKYTYAEFIEHVSQENCNWIFDPVSIRKRFEPFLNEDAVQEFEDN